MKKIIALSGSTRKSSTNESILRLIAKRYAETLQVEFYTGIAELPFFNPDHADTDVPKAVLHFREAVAAADGVIVCTPEYVFSPPGMLKNALEWTVATTVFSDKPLALIVASADGEATFASLTLILKTIGAKMTDNTTLLIQGARGKVDSEGNLRDATVSVAIDKVVASLLEAMFVR